MRHPVDYEPSQDYGENPTRHLPADHWIIKMFGNYQPDGHTGVDYPCPIGTPVRAVSAGKVIHIGYRRGSYADNEFWIAPGFAGFHYVVDHGAFIGIYAHCSENGARVVVGQRVTEGQVLGPSGNTGGSTGPHLHFEVLPDGFIVNSYMYGRINPATLFGAAAIGSQGSVTPAAPAPIDPLEEIMSYYKDRADFEAWQRRIVDEQIAKATPAIVQAVWNMNAVDPATKQTGPINSIIRWQGARAEAQALVTEKTIATLAKSTGADPAAITAAVAAALGSLKLSITTEGAA